MTHDQLWRALDALAAEHGLSPSGLARAAGLDATAFNVSKRRTRTGRPRWPSTESLARVLAATRTTLADFARLLDGAAAPPLRLPPAGGARRLPLLGMREAAGEGAFDENGYPLAEVWDEIGLPDVPDPHAYVLEIEGADFSPLFRAGDLLVLSPAAPLRRGDRVVVRAAGLGLAPCELLRRSVRRLELHLLGGAGGELRLPLEQVAFVHRIVWISQ
jgi:phage repressor protein C with HTH and peptisase S24 domain